MRPEDIINDVFLFNGKSIRAEDVDFEGKTFEKGEKIYATDGPERGIGVIVSGRAATYRREGSRLRTLEKGDLFGAAMLFCGEKCFKSDVIALTRCNIAFIPYEVALRMIREHPEVGENYIRFLSEQVRLLQEETPGKFGTTTERLMTVLRERAVDGKFRLGFSMKTLASMLGMSRTGLYRAFADLESNGIIRRENKTIYFLQE